jgi:uncharacterized protein YkwD
MIKLIRYAILAGAVLFAASCAPTSSPTSVDAPTLKEQAIAERVFKLVNEERAKVGKSPLRGSNVLNSLAQKNSNAQGRGDLIDVKVKKLDATNRVRYAYLKHGIRITGELIYNASASNSDPAASAVRLWKKGVINKGYLTESWGTAGIGVYRDRDGDVFITALVGHQPGGVPRSMQR